MIREKATKAQDLPHQFEDDEAGSCTLCHAKALDARHLAWETAAEEAVNLWFERELGA